MYWNSYVNDLILKLRKLKFVDMAAPNGNEFWKLRSKHGRDKIFKTPDNLWEACQDYFKQIAAITLGEQNWVGKDGGEVTKNHPIPFLLTGLYLFLG